MIIWRIRRGDVAIDKPKGSPKNRLSLSTFIRMLLPSTATQEEFYRFCERIIGDNNKLIIDYVFIPDDAQWWIENDHHEDVEREDNKDVYSCIFSETIYFIYKNQVYRILPSGLTQRLEVWVDDGTYYFSANI